jgi:hypothetical protein
MPLSQIVSVSIEDGAVAPVDLSSVAQYYGYKNRLINGGMAVDQRNNGASQTLPAAYTYTVDRWFAYSGGANTTGQRVASGVTGVPYVYQITGTAGVTFLQYMQRIEAINIADLAGSAVTLSALISNSTLTTINWYIYIAGSTDNYTAATLYTSGGWTVNSTLTSYNAQFTLPANAANGVWVVFQAGAQTSGTWRIGNAQLEKGVTATSFDYRPYGTELVLCQRYYQRITRTSTSTPDVTGGFATGAAWANSYQATISLPVTMRSAPTIDSSAAATFQFHIGGVTNTALSSISFVQSAVDGVRLTGGWTYAGTNGLSGQVAANNATAYIGFNSEL